MQAHSVSIAFALAASLPACYRTHRLAAPPVPRPVLPDVSLAGSPAPDLSRIVLDVVEGPAVVESLSGGSVSAVAGTTALSGSLQVATRVCVTPCVVDTKPGPRELRFTLVADPAHTSTGFVNVDSRVSAYRHSIGTDRSGAWKGFVGWPVLVAGAIIDIAMGVTAAEKGADTGLIGGAVVGLSLTGLGAWLIHGAVVEEQPGTGVQWHPELTAHP